MLNMVFYSLIIILFTLILIILTSISYKGNPDKEKNRPFECGFDVVGGARLPFCMKFFIVGVIFLIFDVEIALILPLPYGPSYLLFFVIILLLGLSYEWYYGRLEWMYVNWGFIRHPRCRCFWILFKHLVDIGSKLDIIFAVINR